MENVMENVSPDTKRVLRRLKGIRKEIKNEIREKMDKAMPHIRKAVTGDRNLRIRDFRKTAPVVRFVDKASFFFGVNTVLLTEMVLLTNPDLFWIIFIVLCPLLILIRLPLYYVQKYRTFCVPSPRSNAREPVHYNTQTFSQSIFATTWMQCTFHA